MAEFTFPGVGRDRTVCVDGDPGIESIVARSVEARSHALSSRPLLSIEADDQDAGCFEETASRHDIGFESSESVRREISRFHAFTPCAYFRIALSMRTCAWHLQSTPDMACWICTSLAFGFRSRNDFAVRITPFTQNPHCMACSSINAF